MERVWRTRRFTDAHLGLVDLAAPGDVLVAHNLHRFDRPAIAERVPTSPLLALPTLDSLELSVLAFPRRPYHALVKDERLVRDSVPDPLRDTQACQRIVTDAIQALSALPDGERALLQHLLSQLDGAPQAIEGWRALMDVLGWNTAPRGPLDLAHAWTGRVCTSAPALTQPTITMPLLLVSAWLRAAHDQGSVLPAWVRRTWPETPRLTRELRAVRCLDPACAWCTEWLDPDRWLERIFPGYSFRPTPATTDGRSLQRVLVDRGLRGEPTFGILPTGGGKSLCFQVPAEARHRLLGQLTVVISPLQSLMKDQVDSLQERLPHARAIYGGLPSLLRPQVLEEVRSGECGLLYLSPEQFRNASIVRLLGSRELGAIVFDEAHCLSQWGHDFRTDYPYVLKAIAALTESQGVPIPPVFLFTATTQADATRQIVAHVEETTGQPVELFDGGSARTNLTYVVRHVPEPDRLDVVRHLLIEHLGAGTAIVFCGSRARTESVAAALSEGGVEARAYHAGLDADLRREIQDGFLRGGYPVITATNAFGMGVDKDNVRLVVHLDMTSSLEAFLQEAGRAGRDGKPATAVLLWAPGDAEARFSMGSTGDLSLEDLQALWRGIRQLPSETRGEIERRVVTARELLFQEALTGRFDPYEDSEETRVKAGVNWLERAAVLARKENLTHVFTGRPRHPTLRAAVAEMDALDLAPPRRAQWAAVLGRVYSAGDDGMSADDIAVLCKTLTYEDPLEGGLRVLSILNQMVDARLVTMGQTFTAFVAKGVAENSARRLDRWRSREQQVIEALQEADVEASTQVHLRQLADRLTDADAACTPNEVALLLRTWSAAARGQTEGGAAARFSVRRGDVGRMTLDVGLPQLRQWLSTRANVAARALDSMLELAEGTGKQLLISSELERVVSSVEQDLSLRGSLHSAPDAVRSAVGWMHDMRIITVQGGLAVFRSAMSLDRSESNSSLRGDEAKHAMEVLAAHQAQRILRVHVVDRWAQLMLENPEEAEQLRADWFSMAIDEVKAKWFVGRLQAVARPTTEDSYRSIVTDLADPAQEQIVTRDVRKNHLVLAGPGSGKTRVLVHRIAWLLRVRRVRGGQILVVCYTRANAIELRRRLVALVGRDAQGVSVRTLHSVAMGIVGARRMAPGADLSLNDCIPVAAAMLRGEALDASEQSRQRDALLQGFQYLFIDEYQDIDAPKYALLSAIAGRAMAGDQRKLRVFAVGDDDQAIFSWDGASTDFIRSFARDYNATSFVIPHNYRNPRGVLDLAQRLIRPLPDRLKAGETLVVNPARAEESGGGPWADAHPELRGKVVWHRSATVAAAAHDAMSVVRRWLAAGVEAERIGVLARSRSGGLDRLRVSAEKLAVPFRWPLPGNGSLPIVRVREVTWLLDFLDAAPDWVEGHEITDLLGSMERTDQVDALLDWLEPNIRRRWTRSAWRYDLLTWARVERRARTVGRGVHLGTMHSAKGLEFDHVLLLDDGHMADDPEERRLLYVALTRAKRSLQLFSTDRPSPVFAALSGPELAVRPSSTNPAEAPSEHHYGFVGRDMVWLDWLGRQDPGHRAHAAMEQARPGDPFTIEHRAHYGAIVDSAGVTVGMLSASGKASWLPRIHEGLKLRLVAVTKERADEESRPEEFRRQLRVKQWWTGVWEGRWKG